MGEYSVTFKIAADEENSFDAFILRYAKILKAQGDEQMLFMRSETDDHGGVTKLLTCDDTEDAKEFLNSYDHEFGLWKCSCLIRKSLNREFSRPCQPAFASFLTNPHFSQ